MSDKSKQGELQLDRLLAHMTPELDSQIYVFLSLKNPDPTLDQTALMRFQEAEGISYIVSEVHAQNFDAQFRCQRIILKIHSALEAVGFLDAISTALTLNGISSNVVSAFYHDHLFVPVEKAEQTLQVLENLSKSVKT